jgi:hypothetical protein
LSDYPTPPARPSAFENTPAPEASPPTYESLSRRLATLERELREFKRGFEHHRGVDFDELEDRVDTHEVKINDLKTLIISNQTTNGLILQSIDRRLEKLLGIVEAKP